MKQCDLKTLNNVWLSSDLPSNLSPNVTPVRFQDSVGETEGPPGRSSEMCIICAYVYTVQCNVYTCLRNIVFHSNILFILDFFKIDILGNFVKQLTL